MAECLHSAYSLLVNATKVLGEEAKPYLQVKPTAKVVKQLACPSMSCSTDEEC